MSPILLIGFSSTFVGIGIGGVIAYFINGLSKSIGTIYAVSAGLILGLISFEIAPESIRIGSWTVFLLGFLTGCIVFKLMHLWPNRKYIIQTKLQKYQKTGLFLALIIAILHFPLGVLLGASEQKEFSLPLLKAIIIHNIPEGMILFTPLFMVGFRFRKMLLLTIIVSVPVAFGALIGGMMGIQNDFIWSFLMSLAIGLIYMVTIKEVLPESIKHSSNRYSFLVSLISFFLLGVYLLYF